MENIVRKRIEDPSRIIRGRVLAVEDDATTRMILVGLLEELAYDVIEAENGRQALEIIAREIDLIDVIVMDKQMPELDGLEVVRRLKLEGKTSRIPVVMVTGATQGDEIREGLDAGVFYYLTKPYEADVFQSVISSAMREAMRRDKLKLELQKHQASFGFIKNAEFTIRTLDDADDLACFLANCFPTPETALPGLSNLLVNAIEHGNLEIGYEEKSTLLKEGRWRDEIAIRENDSEYKDRLVQVRMASNENDVTVVIRDEGHGFDWKNYMEIDPARALHNNGRGIAQANKISFDEVAYNHQGNEVTVIAYRGGNIEW